ncbi:MAG: hypothetical protein LC623_02245 [Halobacteriales archaeon]|nr:hypothetical protein [Halobacteriales archaeon]
MNGLLLTGLELIIGAALAFALLYHYQKTRRHQGPLIAVGTVLLGAGLYYLPLDKLGFQWTQAFFPDEATNGLVWFAASSALVLAGLVAIHAGKRRRKR